MFQEFDLLFSRIQLQLCIFQEHRPLCCKNTSYYVSGTQLTMFQECELLFFQEYQCTNPGPTKAINRHLFLAHSYIYAAFLPDRLSWVIFLQTRRSWKFQALLLPDKLPQVFFPKESQELCVFIDRKKHAIICFFNSIFRICIVMRFPPIMGDIIDILKELKQ